MSESGPKNSAEGAKENAQVISLADYLKADPMKFAVRAHELGSEVYERLRHEFVKFVLDKDNQELANMVSRGELSHSHLAELINQLDTLPESERVEKKMAGLAMYLAVGISDTRSNLTDLFGGKEVSAELAEQQLRHRFGLK